VLHDPIFAGVIRNDHQHAAWGKPIAEAWKRLPQRLELMVDRDPDRLKEPSKIRRSSTRTKSAPDRPHQVVARLKRAMAAPPHDLARQTLSARFITIFAEDPRQFCHVCVIEKLCRCLGRTSLSGAAQPHVQRHSFAKGEATLRAIELMGGDTKVEEDTIESSTSESVDLVDGGKVSENWAEAPTLHGGPHPLGRRGNRIRVAVERSD
jgi:hypothetical protein